MPVLHCIILALIACSPSPSGNRSERAAAQGEAGSSRAEQPSLYGRWQIVEVNGAAVRGLPGRGAAEPTVSFGPESYGGDSGCNSFGGVGLLIGDRWFAEPPMATQQGCGDYTPHESAIFRILAGGPSLSWKGADGVMLRTAKESLDLRRLSDAPDRPRGAAATLMAGSRWELFALDGVGIELPGARHPARLTFEAERWSLETPCAVHGGAWRQVEKAVVIEAGDAAARPCRAELAQPSKALARAVTGRLGYVTGPNGELVLASGSHWLTGRQDVTFTRGEGDLLSGRWRIVSVTGAAPPASQRTAELAFGPGAFSVWDGCQRSEGVAIAVDRRLFIRGSGVVTLANCPADELRAEINRIVAASPRIARTAGQGLALISDAGTLRLARSSAQAFGTGVARRLQPGTTFELAGGAAPPARLVVGPGDRFAVTLPCGSFDGRWRNARGFTGDYVRFGPDRPPAGCGEQSTAMRLYNFFTGDVHVAIGPNRDIALFVSRGDSLPARLR